MISNILIMITVLFQIIVLVVLLVLSVRMIGRSNELLTAVFLTFMFSMWLLTDLYWVIYDYMRPDRRMPFAVNEIGECALFLLMSALLSTAVNYRLSSAKQQEVGAVLFAACNVVLWIAWSGEWAQDLLFGAVFAFFLCNVACALKSQQCLSENEWIGLGIGCALLVLFQGSIFFMEPQIKKTVDIACYIFLITVSVYWAYKLIAASKKQVSPKAMLCLVFALLSWVMMAKYMSAGMWYHLFLIVETIIQLIVFLSVRKVVA